MTQPPPDPAADDGANPEPAQSDLRRVCFDPGQVYRDADGDYCLPLPRPVTPPTRPAPQDTPLEA